MVFFLLTSKSSMRTPNRKNQVGGICIALPTTTSSIKYPLCKRSSASTHSNRRCRRCWRTHERVCRLIRLVGQLRLLGFCWCCCCCVPRVIIVEASAHSHIVVVRLRPFPDVTMLGLFSLRQLREAWLCMAALRLCGCLRVYVVCIVNTNTRPHGCHHFCRSSRRRLFLSLSGSGR